jgi:tetratricopeptide (TPR) repeat protein
LKSWQKEACPVLNIMFRLRQLVLAVLALRNELGYKEIAARTGKTHAQVSEALARRRKSGDLDDKVYEALLPGVLPAAAPRRAAATAVTACLEALDEIDRADGFSDEELIAVEESVRRMSRGYRRFLLAAVKRLRTAPLGEAAPHVFELPFCRRQAKRLFEELRRLDRRSRLAVVRLTRRFQVWALVEACSEESENKASRSVQAAAAWARLALAVAWRVRGPQSWRNAIRGYALAHWANILRVRGALQAAESCFERAWRLWKAGSDPAGALDPGRLLDLEGSLRRGQRRFAEALALFEKALPLSRCPERVLIKKGFTCEVMGDYKQAVAALLEAGPGAERRGDPRLLYMQRFNLAVTYTHLGRFSEAAELVERVRDAVEAVGDAIEIARTNWLEGRIQAGMGFREDALSLLREARGTFEAEHMDYDVALCLLEEAALLLAGRRTRDVKALSLDLAVVFRSKGVHREALAALRLFQEAVETDTATVALARRVLAYLFLARHDQGLRFES